MQKNLKQTPKKTKLKTSLITATITTFHLVTGCQTTDLKQKKEIINKYYKNIWSSCNDMWKDNNKQQNLPTFTANEAKIYFQNKIKKSNKKYGQN